MGGILYKKGRTSLSLTTAGCLGSMAYYEMYRWLVDNGVVDCLAVWLITNVQLLAGTGGLYSWLAGYGGWSRWLIVIVFLA